MTYSEESKQESSENPENPGLSGSISGAHSTSHPQIIRQPSSCVPVTVTVDDNVSPFTFSDVVDKACNGLMDQQIKYSLRRIREMQEDLICLERELDAFLELNTI